MQPKLLVRFGGLATRNPPAEEQERRPGPTLHLISLPDVGRLVGRRERGVRIGSGFGRRSLVVFRVRMRLPGLGVAGGWVEMVPPVWWDNRRSPWVRCRGATCPLLSEKRSLFFGSVSVGCVRSPAAWAVHRRRSHVSCAGQRRNP